MSAAAADVVDKSWRILQGGEEKRWKRGARMARCNARRARGDRCHTHAPHGEGPKSLALERAIRAEPIVELDAEASIGFEAPRRIKVEKTDLASRHRIRRGRVFDPAVDEVREALRREIRDVKLHLLTVTRQGSRRHLKQRLDDLLSQLNELNRPVRTV